MPVFGWPDVPRDERDVLRLLVDAVRRFGSDLDVAGMDAEGQIDPATLARMGEIGLFGVTIPAAHGGAGLGVASYARVMAEVATLSPSLAVTMGAHLGIGCKGIVLHGTDAQRQRYLPRCATGETLAAMAMTEPDSGSAIASISTTATQRPDGVWLLNGAKTYITNGGTADVLTVFARALEAGPGRSGRPTAFIVERSYGMRSGPPMDKMGIRASNTTELFFDDVPVPADNVLAGIGRGLALVKELLCHGRVGLAGAVTGGCAELCRRAADHARSRRIAGHALAQFGMIKEKIARMVVATYAAESMVHFTAGFMDAGAADHYYESAMAKVLCSDVGCFVANEAMQIAGGAGFLKDLAYERFYRDARIATIFEGTNEVLRAQIAMGSMRGVRDRLRAIASVLPAEASIPESIRREASLIDALAGEVDEELGKLHDRHGARMATEQILQRRLADVHIALYGMVCCVSRAADAVKRGPASRDLLHTRAYCLGATRRVRRALRSLERPEDVLAHRIADIACGTAPSEAPPALIGDGSS